MCSCRSAKKSKSLDHHKYGFLLRTMFSQIFSICCVTSAQIWLRRRHYAKLQHKQKTIECWMQHENAEMPPQWFNKWHSAGTLKPAARIFLASAIRAIEQLSSMLLIFIFVFNLFGKKIMYWILRWFRFISAVCTYLALVYMECGRREHWCTNLSSACKSTKSVQPMRIPFIDQNSKWNFINVRCIQQRVYCRLPTFSVAWTRNDPTLCHYGNILRRFWDNSAVRLAVVVVVR